MEENNLIFLISQPRSGSTLTQKILGNHSKIYTRSEPWIMLHPSYALKDIGIYTEYGFETERKAFNSFLEELPEGKTTYISELKKMYLNLYSYYLDNTEHQYFLDKTPRYYLIVDELLQIFPKAKFILLIRNPLAVLGSIINTWSKSNWFNLSKCKYDLIRAIETYIDVLNNRQDDFLIIHYEELISEDKKTLHKLFDYLDFEKNVLNYDNDEKWIYGDQVNVYVKQGIDRTNDSKWQQDLINPQYWRVMHDYLHYIGKEKFEKLGYSFSENLEILEKSMPTDTLVELKSKTFSLFSFLDDTRECLIENQKKDKTIAEKNKTIKSILASKTYKLGYVMVYPVLKIMEKFNNK